MRPSVFRIIIKDLVDFMVVFLVTALMTYAVYRLSPIFKPTPLSILFYEQILEVFFENPKLVLWALGLGLGVSIIYYLFCFMLYDNTVGGRLMGLRLSEIKTNESPKVYRSLPMALGAFFGVLFFLISPLFAWWLDKNHRGFSEKLSGTAFFM